jgi:dynein light intermediate chain
MSTLVGNNFKNKEEKLEAIRAEIEESARLNLQRAQNITLTKSLVKYDTPFLVSSSKTNKKTLQDLNSNEEEADIYLNNIIKNGGHQGQYGEAFDFSVKDALNKILPPKKITEREKTWVQYVTCCPVTKAEVVNLQEGLDRRLQTEKGRETGICPIREQLYTECFDELIRQVTINCLERGILLKRIKKEVEMTTNSYQTLYESSIAYGLRTLLLSEEEKKRLNDEIEKTQMECEQIEEQIKEIENKIEEHKEIDAKQREEAKNAHEEEMIEGKKKANAIKEKLKEKLTFIGK